MVKKKNSNAISVVIGLGKSGISAAKLLKKKGKKVVVIEKERSKEYLEISKRLEVLGITVALGKSLVISSFYPWIEDISEVITSPAIPWDHMTLVQLRNLGIKVQGEISLAWENLKHIPWIAITGTNGKTTVTAMINHVLKKNNINSLMGGNIGYPASEIALNELNNGKSIPSCLVMELSSYQIESASEITPQIGIWTTFTPDHLERHKNIDNYFKIKKKLIDQSSIRIYNSDDEYLNNHKEKLSDGIWISAQGEENGGFRTAYWINQAGIVCEKESELFHSSILSMPGEHNLQNLLIVTAALRKLDLSAEEIKFGLSDFYGVPHRLEYIGKIDNIKVFNDSKATNYDSAIVGLKSIQDPLVVLAGGKIKQGEPSKWLEQLNKSACSIYLFGESAQSLKELILESGFKAHLSIHRSLTEASFAAFKMGKGLGASSILLSPACSSFDQYQNFEERGNDFKELFKKYKEKV
ncbi:UDP-N-acetylmuramoyl-L-alanine--D-glutamate ligase [Prochlorococcus sp. MIT 1223]|uniref:UDP-N-acetylmuramoyl-L-alanine--D-glutamate ligase n=1 Tax=Prochlorococcus sp. MIT 1223 TaxID=3096217 RepID=UPI002A75AE4D|nr:UDP-N-acetylmuramoyl-L-alanine--D-glutamate ligase [Prochlorococcus sp. MIT 1223]